MSGLVVGGASIEPALYFLAVIEREWVGGGHILFMDHPVLQLPVIRSSFERIVGGKISLRRSCIMAAGSCAVIRNERLYIDIVGRWNGRAIDISQVIVLAAGKDQQSKSE